MLTSNGASQKQQDGQPHLSTLPMKTIRSLQHLLIYSLSVLSLILSACAETSMPVPVGETISVPSPSYRSYPKRAPHRQALPAFHQLQQGRIGFTYDPDEGQPVYPLSNLRILSPGAGSRLISPIQTDLSVMLGVDSTIQIELLNANGELLVKKLIRYAEANTEQRILIHPVLDFEIGSEEEEGRLVVKTYDTFNRLISMSSCELTLLSAGENDIRAANVPYEPFLITEPVSGSTIQGGVVTVSGYVRLVSHSFILFELVDEKGIGLANRYLMVKGEPGGSPVVFTTTLPYKVYQATAVRLIVRQALSPLPGPAVATSLLITIK